VRAASDGAGEASDGARKASDGAGEASDGARKASDGAGEASDGARKASTHPVTTSDTRHAVQRVLGVCASRRWIRVFEMNLVTGLIKGTSLFFELIRLGMP